MDLKYFFILFVVLITSPVFGQENGVMLKGKVQNPKNDVSNVLVINLKTKKSTISDAFGLFSIEVKLGELIQFSAVQYVSKEITVTDTILKENRILVDLLENVINLKEVTVMPYGLTGQIGLDVKNLDNQRVVNSSSLELPNANVELLTHNERLLLEADRGEFATGGIQLDTLFLFPIVGVYMDINLHKTLNFISGRTRKLKDAVLQDESLKMEDEIIKRFSKETISKGFGISSVHIDGFFTFCLSQPDFFKVLEAKNSTQIWEYFRVKSYEFKKLN